MRDAVAIFPPVAWLAVWNRNITIDRKQEKGKEQHCDDDDEDQDDEDDDDDNDNPDRNRSGVLYGRLYGSDGGAAAHGDTDDDRTQRDLLTRRIGLAQGLIDFTRSFASKKPRRHHHDSEDEPEEDIDPTKEIKVVHSQNQRLVFIQPEENYWIVGAVDRYITPAQGTQARERATASTSSANSSNKDKQKKSTGQSQTRLQPSSFLPNEVLTDLLRRAYAEFRLFHGTFGSILESEGVNTLRAGLATFFDTWRQEAKLIPLGLPKAIGLPNEDNFPSPPANMTIVAVSQSGLIDIPSITTLTPSDLLALAYHLASILPKPTPPSVPSASASSQKKKKVKKQPSLSASTWKSLNLGGISSYLPSMPSMPGSSSSSSVLQKSSTGTGEALPKSATAKSSSLGSVSSQQVDPPISTDSQSGKRTSSGSAWMPSFNLFGGANKVKPKESESKGSTEHAEGLPETSETSLQASDGEPSSEQTEVNPLVEPHDTAPSEASLEALSEALIENISPQVLPPVADTSPSSGPPGVAKTSAQAGTPAETIREENIQTTCTWHTVRDVFIGQNGAQQRCHCVHNEDIAVAFVEAIDGYSCSNERSTDPFNHTEAGAYLRDLAKVVIPGSKRERDDSSRARTYLTFASSDCDQVQEQVIDDRASASTASLGQRFNLALTGKTDSDKLMKPGVTEMFVRTFFSQWLVAKRDDTQDTHTKVTILPKSIGKEGSLVDADAEMRRLAQK